MPDFTDWISELFSSPATDTAVSVASGAAPSGWSMLADAYNSVPAEAYSAPDYGNYSGFIDQLGDMGSQATSTPAPDYGNYSGFIDQLGDAGASGQSAGLSLPTEVSRPIGFMDQLDKYAKMMDRPGVKTGASLGMGALSMWDAMKRNKMDKAAREAQAQQLAARQAKAQQYDAPLRLTMNRQAVAKPQARRGESLFFTGNKLPAYAHGGSTPHYVRGGDAGQADTIDAKVSPGEYIFDADSVSSLGDGNNEAGAAKLDQMRQNIRTHKRAAPSNKIPPKAKSPLAYMKGVK